jgi:hypothetical protein
MLREEKHDEARSLLYQQRCWTSRRCFSRTRSRPCWRAKVVKIFQSKSIFYVDVQQFIEETVSQLWVMKASLQDVGPAGLLCPAPQPAPVKTCDES